MKRWIPRAVVLSTATSEPSSRSTRESGTESVTSSDSAVACSTVAGSAPTYGRRTATFWPADIEVLA